MSPAPSAAAVRLCLFGAAPDTANLGVSALFESVVAGLAQRMPELALTVFDNGWGQRPGRLPVADGAFGFRRCGSRNSRRYHRYDSLWNLRACCWLGGLGNPGSRAMLAADAVLDLSGGDSFTDLYGRKRFSAVTLPKRIALERRMPLVLLPQSYGPFAGVAERRLAERITRGTELAWARDARSYEVLKELLGSHFDPERHRSGVDMAFGLPSRRPEAALPEPIERWIADPATRTLGVNVSGLVYRDPAEARQQYGLRADYRAVVHGLLERLLDETPAKLLLVPHVALDAIYAPEDSDVAASERVHEALASRYPDRMALVPATLAASEMKWVISRLDWFCGTRMHSTIAALSSGVPAAAIAYSGKTLGVFETCGVGDRVVDPRAQGTADCIEQLVACAHAAEPTRETLRQRLPEVLARADAQLDELVARCRSLHARRAA